MHLTPRELERLTLFNAALLAQRRLDRGARLGATEAIALVSDAACELAWDGLSLDDVIEGARAAVQPHDLLPGVAALVPVIQIEALFPYGTVLVDIANPFGFPDELGPGAVVAQEGTHDLLPNRTRRSVTLTNSGSMGVWISSHFPLRHLNPAIAVDPSLSRDFRLDTPSGQATFIGAGESKTITVVSFDLEMDSEGGHGED